MDVGKGQSEYAGTHNFIDGVLGLYDRRKWLEAASHHEALDFGEDSYLGLITLLHGIGVNVAETRCCATSILVPKSISISYFLQCSDDSLVEILRHRSFAPPTFFGCLCSGSPQRNQGYGAASLCKQRTFRWVITNVRRKLQLVLLIVTRQRQLAKELGILRAQLFILVQIMDCLDTWMRLASLLLVVTAVATTAHRLLVDHATTIMPPFLQIILVILVYTVYISLRTAFYFAYAFKNTLLELPDHPNVMPAKTTSSDPFLEPEPALDDDDDDDDAGAKKMPPERGLRMAFWAIVGDLWYTIVLMVGTWHAVFYTVPWVLDRKGVLGKIDPNVALATKVHSKSTAILPPRPLTLPHPRFEINSYRRYNIARYAVAALVLFFIDVVAIVCHPPLVDTLHEWHYFFICFIFVAAAPFAFKLSKCLT